MSKKSTAAAVSTIALAAAPWRVVVRGNTPEGARVRRVKNTMESADHGAIAEAMVKEHKLAEPFFAVYPPVGILCSNGISKGFVKMSDGTVAKAKA